MDNIWVTQTGEKIKYKDLRNNHLVNILSWIEKNGLTQYNYSGLLQEERRRATTTPSPLCRYADCTYLVKTNGRGAKREIIREDYCRRHKNCGTCTASDSYPLDNNKESWYARFTSIRSAQ